MNKYSKISICILAIFIVGMTLGVAFADPVDAKTVKKGKFKATFSNKVWKKAKKSPGMWDKKVKNSGIKKYKGKKVTAYIYTQGNNIGVSWSAGGKTVANKYLGKTSKRI